MPDETNVFVMDEHRVDRPAFSDQGDQHVHPVPDPTQPETPAEKPVRKRRKTADQLSDDELLRDVGIEPVFSTSEAAEFFDRSNQWLYWGLREGVFLDDAGEIIDPDRIGHPVRGRRRFTVPILKEIMKSSYRRGNLDRDQAAVIARRIKLAEQGIEWREREGWRYTHLGRNRHRWVKPDLTVWDEKNSEWRLAPGVKLRNQHD